MKYPVRILQEWLRSESGENGYNKPTDPVELLAAVFYSLSRLAGQIEQHSQKAPYPHFTAALRRIASQKREHAALVRNKIESMGGAVTPLATTTVSGKNHWERMTRDLKDQADLESRLATYEIHLSREAPEIAQLLRQIADVQPAHRRMLVELIARSDPQAEQT